MVAGKENLIDVLRRVVVVPSLWRFPTRRKAATLDSPPFPRKRLVLYYVKFSMTGWKLISTLNKMCWSLILEQQTQITVRPVKSGEKVEQTFPQNPGQCFTPLPSAAFLFFFSLPQYQWCSMIRSLFEPSWSPHTNTFLLIGLFKGWEWVGRRRKASKLREGA